MFVGDYEISALGVSIGLRDLFELVGKGFVVDEGPGVIEFVIPCALQVLHGLDELVELFVADEGEEGGVYAIAVRIIRIVIVALHPM